MILVRLFFSYQRIYVIINNKIKKIKRIKKILKLACNLIYWIMGNEIRDGLVNLLQYLFIYSLDHWGITWIPYGYKI